MKENQSLHIIDMEDHSSTIMFEWDEWKLNLFTFFYGFSALIAIAGKTMIVYYIIRIAPKGRPLNRMFLIDQVCDFRDMYAPTFTARLLSKMSN